MSRAKTPPVHDVPAYVLHQHAWSESSAVLDVFTPQHGRVVLVAKGVKRPYSQYRAVLLPWQLLRLSWSGGPDVHTLRAAHWQGGHVMPRGEALLAAYYLNELLLRLWVRDDPQPGLFARYAAAVRCLCDVNVAVAAPVVRAFELVLLRCLGYLPALDRESAHASPVQPEARYLLHPEWGLCALSEAHPEATLALPGAAWLALETALQPSQGFAALVQVCESLATPALRQGLARLLHYHSGVSVFHSRRLWSDVQHLRPVDF